MYEFRFGMRFIKPRALNLKEQASSQKQIRARVFMKRGRNEAALPRPGILMALTLIDRRSNYNDITLIIRI